MTENTGATAESTGSFFQALFDMSFTNLITMRFLRVIYMLLVALSGIGVVVTILMAFTQSFSAGLTSLVLGAGGWILYVIIIRVSLEVIAVLFKIKDNTEKMAQG